MVGGNPAVHTPGPVPSPDNLAVISILAGAPDEALMTPLAPRALGLGEGLLEGMLLGVHLVVEELGCQLCPITNLDLCGSRQKPSLC